MARSTLTRFVLGVALVVAGIALVEALFFLGLRPLSPLGWPGMAMLVGAALGGMSGLGGGALTLELYYAVNFRYRYRFPEFCSNPDVKARDNAVRIAEKIVEEARQPLRIDGREIVATTSIGLAYGDGSEDEEALLKRADGALYDAKAAGRNCYRLAR